MGWVKDLFDSKLFERKNPDGTEGTILHPSLGGGPMGHGKNEPCPLM